MSTRIHFVRRQRRRTHLSSIIDAFSDTRTVLLLLLVLLCFPSVSWQQTALGERALQELDASQIASLISSPDPSRNVDPKNPNSHLSKILIPRVADTENNTIVKNYIVSTLKALKWHIEEDAFTDNTPYGMKKFTNIIATKDPDAPRRIILAAHFDSKYFSGYPMNQFVGATDSAAPCAMLLDLAETIDPLLERRKEKLALGMIDDEDVSDTTLQLVFFDGEEAFKEWTDTDSVYGARHLAHKWSTTYLTPHPKRRLRPSATELTTIEHLVLLDLLGSANPSIQSYFIDTAWLFDAMVSAEKRIASAGAFKMSSSADDKWRSFFRPRTGREDNYGFIGDDHTPFLNLGVSVLHIIANPFPHVWHTLQDDASALDLETMKRWNMIMRVFISDYLGLEPNVKSQTVSRSAGELVSYLLSLEH
ncbi:hypothetical protein BD410DRAFT_718967 [Rickenella mellea]|uniref:Peptide hydrolase n=1 Tax=Rickenella mellea TaxID=50990 RepID=A0A4Y7QDN7_9AGAM|nr:hypothetical protein BD410DRAFT_718967 [Rickenella mellea]